MTTVNAKDADTDAYGLIQYSFSDLKEDLKQIFAIDESTGTISVVGAIDFEQNKRYEIRVEAKDQGGFTGTSKVVISH